MSSMDDRHSEYYREVQTADQDLEDALSHIRARQDDGEISAREAADERVRLLENHLQAVHALRVKHLGPGPGPGSSL